MESAKAAKAVDVRTARHQASRTASRHLSDITELLRRTDPGTVAAVAGILWDAWQRDRTVFIIGNGGSATTASHIAWDLTRQSQGCGRPILRVRALTDSVAVITAIANDEGSSRIFADQIRAQAQAGDVLIWLSCSCRSPSIVAGIEEALIAGVTIVGLGGCDGGTLHSFCDQFLHLPSHEYGHIEAAHLAVGHCIAAVLRERALDRR
jgi:D-sedoheptulose 7-phosphate isomerase